MKYLIIGGGPCGDSAVKELRKNDPDGEITLITDENFPPYRRLSLTKQVFDLPFDKISLNTEKSNINLVKGVKAQDIDPEKKTVLCSNGKKYVYDKLLIATGISPRKLNYEGFFYLRTAEDFEKLKPFVKEGKRCVIIGAGFTGLELSSELCKRGCKVSVIYMESLPCTKVLPESFCREIVDTFEKNGVEMLKEDSVDIVEFSHNEYKITTKQGKNIVCDFVVASVGNTPNNPFGDKILTENGIAVNEYLETSIKDVYAAGDVAQFPSTLYGTKMRKEFMDNAIKSGKVAALNMVGQKTVHNPILNTFFDAFDLGYKALGEYGMNMNVSVAETDLGKVLFYRQDNNVLKGVLFWKMKPVFSAAKCIEDQLTLSDEEYMYMFKLR